MFDFRLIKWLLVGVVTLYMMERLLPSAKRSLFNLSIADSLRGLRPRDPVLWRRSLRHLSLLREHEGAVGSEGVTELEKLVILAVYVLCLSLPDWIRVPW